MQLIPIKPENITLVWNYALPFVEDVIPYLDSKYTISDIEELLQKSLLILWMAYNEDEKEFIGILMTKVVAYPQIKSLAIFLLASKDFSKMMEAFRVLKSYAYQINCQTIEFYGRPGWEKKLQALNFEKTHVLMRLSL